MEQTHDLFRRTMPTPQTRKAQPSESGSGKMPWLNASCLRSSQMRATCVCDCLTAKTRWDGHAEEFGQPGQGDSRRDEVPPEKPPAAMGRSGRRRRRKGKCHRCGEGHCGRDCRAPEGELASAPATKVQQTSPRPAARMPPTCKSPLWRRTCPGS